MRPSGQAAISLTNDILGSALSTFSQIEPLAFWGRTLEGYFSFSDALARLQGLIFFRWRRRRVMEKERTVVLHYHLFKNAGTSVDEVLQRNFGKAWVTREFLSMDDNNTASVEQWIRETPEALSYSSHTMLGPIPKVEGVRVVSIMLLRDPIDRIKSVYRFERNQSVETWESTLAKSCDFEEYVLKRLNIEGDRQCRNFHTARLATLMPENVSELERAKKALKDVSVVGRVEKFGNFLEDLCKVLQPTFEDFKAEMVWENKGDSSQLQLDDKMIAALRDANMDDFDLLEYLERQMGV